MSHSIYSSWLMELCKYINIYNIHGEREREFSLLVVESAVPTLDSNYPPTHERLTVNDARM